LGDGGGRQEFTKKRSLLVKRDEEGDPYRLFQHSKGPLKLRPSSKAL